MLAKSGFPSSGEKSPILRGRSNQRKYQIKSILRSKTGIGGYAGTTQEHAPATQAFLGKIGIINHVLFRVMPEGQWPNFWLSSPVCSSVFSRNPSDTCFVAGRRS